MIEKVRRLLSFDLVKILIGIALLWFSFSGVDWDILVTSLDNISIIGLVGVIGTMILSLYLKILRSFLLVENFGVRVSFIRIGEAFLLGQTVNFALPSRGGDIVRIGYMSAEDVSTLPQSTAAVMLEKILDIVALTAVAVGVAAYLPVDKAFWVRSWLLPISILSTIGLIVLILLGPVIWARLQGVLAKATHGWMKKIITLVDQFIQSSRWLRDPRRAVQYISLTILIWFVMWSTNMVLFQAFKLKVPLVAGGLVLILAYIGVLPNLMPGNVGPFYFFVQLGMAPFGIPQEEGLAYTILLHAIITMTPIVACGVTLVISESVRKNFISLWKSRTSLSKQN